MGSAISNIATDMDANNPKMANNGEMIPVIEAIIRDIAMRTVAKLILLTSRKQKFNVMIRNDNKSNEMTKVNPNTMMDNGNINIKAIRKASNAQNSVRLIFLAVSFIL